MNDERQEGCKASNTRIFADTLLFISVRATADLSVLKFGIQFLPFIVFLNRVAEQKRARTT